MSRSSVLGENVEDEEFGKFWRVDGVVGRNEDRLFAKTVDDDENGGESVGLG